MNTKPRHPIALLLLSALLLAWASVASAVTITVDSDTLWSTIVSGNGVDGMPAADDDIIITSGGTLWVDIPGAVCRNIQIGDATTSGILRFQDYTVTTLTLNGLITWGGTVSGNAIILGSGAARNSTLILPAGFLASGSGTGSFQAGLGVVAYTNPTNQTVLPLAYKDLDLIGSGTKVLSTGITVNGVLKVGGTVTNLTGSAVTYGSLASLAYAGTVAQKTTDLEFPAAMSKAITNNNTVGVTLNGTKGMANVMHNSGIFNDGGYSLYLSNAVVVNSGTFAGTGKLVLAGTATQYLVGAGHYGNLRLEQSASVPSTFYVDGRLSIVDPAKLYLTGSTATAGFLSLGYPLVHKAAGTYAYTNTLAANLVPAAFGGAGFITVATDPAPVFSNLTPSQSIPYNNAIITNLSGQVSGFMTNAAGNFGTVYPANGDKVYVLINGKYFTNTTTLGNGTFGFTNLDLSGIGIGNNYTISYSYLGGNNLAASTTPDTSTTLTVTGVPITVTADYITKVYNSTNGDPALTWTITSGGLVGSDKIAGWLVRAPGNHLGTYAITTNNTFTITNSLGVDVITNYSLTFVGTNFVITAKPINVTAIATNKTYGTVLDPIIQYTLAPALLADDTLTGNLTRAFTPNSGTNAGSYPISLGSLTNAYGDYALTLANTVNFTINPLQIFISFIETNKIYGEPDPVILTNIDPPLAFGDVLTNKSGIGPCWPTNQNVGLYTITSGGLTLSKSNNYSVTWSTTNLFEIKQRPVTITATIKTNAYGTYLAPSTYFSYEAVTAGRGLLKTTQNGAGGYTNLTTTPTITVTNGTAALPTQYSPSGTYYYYVSNAGSDSNYAPVIATTWYTGTSPWYYQGYVTITNVPLIITAQNKSKVYDNLGYSNFTVIYDGFLGTDTNTSQLAGTLTYTGNAVTATNPGCYIITPTGVTASNYDITFVSGWLTISEAPKTYWGATWTNSLAISGPILAAANPSIAFLTNETVMMNRANGTAGQNWTLLIATNKLYIYATAADPFRIDLMTVLSNATPAAGEMAKWDATRPYSWEVLRTTNGIVNFTNASQFVLNYTTNGHQGIPLFQNPQFSGQFGVTTNAKSILVTYNPVGPNGGASPNMPVPIPSGYTVGYITNGATLLGYSFTNDVDLLYLEPSTTTVWTNALTIYLKVANLKQPISGVNAYINFDSRYFITSGSGAPAVTAGGGDWATLIYTNWNVSGDLDTVMGVSLTSSGTSDNGTVAKIVLTPTRTATGTSRVAFRHDGDAKADGTGSLLTYLQTTNSSTTILPVRVMTDELVMTNDASGPVMDKANFGVVQVQPHSTSIVSVKDSVKHVVVTSGATGEATYSSPLTLIITNCYDPGLGLQGPPTVYLTNYATSQGVTLSCATPTSVTAPFSYTWNVAQGMSNGAWSAVAYVYDFKGNRTISSNAFTLNVNTKEIDGIVELQDFKGTNRTVLFVSGPTKTNYVAANTNRWSLNLKFTSGLLMEAGAFQDRMGIANRIFAVATNTAANNAAYDPLSTYLRYGSINDLPTLAGKIINKSGGVATYIHELFYGYFDTDEGDDDEFDVPEYLWDTIEHFYAPSRAIDSYMQAHLSASTFANIQSYKLAYTNYMYQVYKLKAGGSSDLSTLMAAASAVITANAALESSLLNDFNTIIQSDYIYTPVRFAQVTLSQTSTNLLLASPVDLVALNRSLLHDAYPDYTPGKLEAAAATALNAYAGGADSTLEGYLLRALDAIVYNSTMWPTPVNTYDQGIYNEVVFLGVTLSSDSVNGLLSFPTGDALVLLNQKLLAEAFPGLFTKAPLTPPTVAATTAFVTGSNVTTAVTFETNVIRDINALIGGGTSIANTNRFLPWIGTIDWTSELGLLLAQNYAGTLNSANLVRLNRLLLELGYDSELTKSTQAKFRLTAVPVATTNVSAKTAWNLRVRLAAAPTALVPANVYFVGDGTPDAATKNWSAAGTDYFLRGGDIDGDNWVLLSDYNYLRSVFNTSSAAGDIDGNGGKVGLSDWNLMQKNWGKSGDDEVVMP